LSGCTVTATYSLALDEDKSGRADSLGDELKLSLPGVQSDKEDDVLIEGFVFSLGIEDFIFSLGIEDGDDETSSASSAAFN
jgi:hypothetical protein